MGHAIVERYPDNPILRPSDLPAPCCAVYNSGWLSCLMVLT